jgi:gamma-glutamyl-gamma-aminobutyrate hydrolase PuuD
MSVDALASNPWPLSDAGDRVRVAVTQRVVEDLRLRERRDALSLDWAGRLHAWGAIPLLVPNRWPDPEQLMTDWAAQALLLTGGNTPLQDPPRRRRPDDAAPERDITERRLIAWAVARRIPILGVCRGAELLNLVHGGRISAVDKGTSHAGIFHVLQPARDDEGAVAVPFPPATVNSYHDLWIAREDLAAGLRPFALGPDGSVEGFYHPSLPLLGVMWHPERAGPHSAALDALLRESLRGRVPWLAATTQTSAV